MDEDKVCKIVNEMLEILENRKIDAPEALGAAYMLSGIAVAEALKQYKNKHPDDPIDNAKRDMLMNWGDNLARDVVVDQMSDILVVDGEVISKTVH